MTVGKYTYGHDTINVKQWLESPHNGKLVIGNFCSIADKVTIFLGGNHRNEWMTTFPFGWTSSNFKKVSDHISTKGDVIIENDVWIGSNVTIMSGVRIGNGAILAANSHIIKDVEPYTIVGGNPAKFIKKRFPDDTIKKLLQIQWWNWSDNKINENIDILCSSDYKKLNEL